MQSLSLAKLFAGIERCTELTFVAVTEDVWPDLRIGLEMDGRDYLALPFERRDGRGGLKGVAAIVTDLPRTWTRQPLSLGTFTGTEVLGIFLGAVQGRGEDAPYEASEGWAAVGRAAL